MDKDPAETTESIYKNPDRKEWDRISIYIYMQ